MTKKYFVPNEDFNKMIQNSLPNKEIRKLNLISTGWTNIVYEAEINDNESYFFRFPRDNFWIRTIVKDYEFAKYIKDKTDYTTSDLKLQNNNSRFFSMHKKINGVALTEKMNKLKQCEIDKISYEISKFMYQLHSLSFDRDNIFSCDNIGLNLVDFLNELIEIHLDDESKKFWKYKEFAKKDNNCLVHGDFNPWNIIIDENNNICAIIDFGFGGFGNKYFDISRIIGRLPKAYKEPIIKSYESISGEKLDYSILDNEIEIWSNIDNGYINYMRKIGIYK